MVDLTATQPTRWYESQGSPYWSCRSSAGRIVVEYPAWLTPSGATRMPVLHKVSCHIAENVTSLPLRRTTCGSTGSNSSPSLVHPPLCSGEDSPCPPFSLVDVYTKIVTLAQLLLQGAVRHNPGHLPDLAAKTTLLLIIKPQRCQQSAFLSSPNILLSRPMSALLEHACQS